MRILKTRALALPALIGLALYSAAWQPAMAAVAGDSAPATITLTQGSPQRQAAAEGLSVLVNRLIANGDQTGAPRILAVDQVAQLRQATLGYGFEVNLLEPNALLAGKSIDASAHPSGEWRFVVLSNGHAVGLITVAKMHGQWQTVMAGASEMAREINDVVSRYASREPTAQLRFIRSQQGVTDLIEVMPATGAQPQYIPLLSARVMLAHPAAMARSAGVVDLNQAAPDTASALPETQILPSLVTRVRTAVNFPRSAH